MLKVQGFGFQVLSTELQQKFDPDILICKCSSPANLKPEPETIAMHPEVKFF